MRKLSFLLILVLIFSLAVACGTDAPAEEEPMEESEETTEESEEMDAVTTASIVDNEAAFIASIGKDGNWITAALKDLSFEEALVLEGTIDHDGTEERKIALYTSNKDHSIKDTFTLVAPKLTIKSDNTLLKGGTFDTDLYIEANNVTLQKTIVTGNVYFAKEKYKDSFTVEEATIEGEMMLQEADVMSTPSIVDNEAAFKASIGKDGNWITAALKDLSFEEALVLEGTIDHDGTEERKIALYTSNKDHSIKDTFTLVAPKLTIKSDNTLLKGGTFDTDLYIEANNVTLQKTIVTGNVYFAKEEYKDSFTVEEATIEGETMVE